MARRNAINVETNSKKKTTCYGVIHKTLQEPGMGYVGGRRGEGPFVVFVKKQEDISNSQVNGYANHLRDGDVVIEFQEIARYVVKNTGPSLEKIGESQSIADETVAP